MKKIPRMDMGGRLGLGVPENAKYACKYQSTVKDMGK